MTGRALSIPLILLLIDSAPVSVHPDSTGRLQISVGYGAAQYEDCSLDCEGNVVRSNPVQVRSGGVRAEAWPSDRSRLTVVAGRIDQRPRGVPARDPYGGGYDGGYYSEYAPYPGGFFGGALLAYEGGGVGAGVGFVHQPIEDADFVPSFYLRLGGLDQAHLRLEVFPPSEVMGVTDWGRAGIGFHQGLERHLGGEVGLAVGPYAQQGNDVPGARLFADLNIPAGRRTDILLRSHFGQNYSTVGWGLAAGVRFNFDLPGNRTGGPTRP